MLTASHNLNHPFSLLDLQPSSVQKIVEAGSERNSAGDKEECCLVLQQDIMGTNSIRDSLSINTLN